MAAVAGGMGTGSGIPMSERLAVRGRPERSAGPPGTAGGSAAATRGAGPATGAPSMARHCWVVDAPGQPGRWPGLLVEWRRRDGWQGRVLYVVPEPAGGTQRVLERWLPAACLRPADLA